MAKEVISRCDVCGTSEDVQEFKIEHGGQAKTVDLCPEHGGPVLKLFELGTDEKPPVKKAKGHAVVAIEDWAPGN